MTHTVHASRVNSQARVVASRIVTRLLGCGTLAGRQVQEPASQSLTSPEDPTAVLFPHIHAADGEIFYGCTLFQIQPIVAEAYREPQAQQASSGAGGPSRQ